MRRTQGKRKKVVVIGGGTGTFAVLSGLKDHPVDIAAIVAMADNGGANGVIREEFGILPPSDVRKMLVALAPADKQKLSELFNYRFKTDNWLSGHTFGNLMLTALERLTGDFERAIDEAAHILSVKGEVIPVTLAKTHLFAELENGKVIKGETNVDIPQHDPHLRIKRVWLSPRANVNPRARKAILDADLVVIGPGDLYSSLLQNVIVEGMSVALKKTKAKIAYVVNLTTKLGETNGFSATDFVSEMERYVGRNVIDYIVVGGKKPGQARLAAYEEAGSSWVETGAIASTKRQQLIVADLVRPRGFIRHDPEKTAKVILGLLK